MAIKKPIPITFNLDSHNSVQSVCAVIHIDDKNTETLDLSLMQGGEHIAISPNSTVTARFVRVKNNALISDDIACTVQENGNIYIPIDNAAAHMLVGEIKIEVNIVDENDILTMQFPLVIRVNNTILADSEISPESEGTIPELLEEAKQAAQDAQHAAEEATEALDSKQDKLTAGENITIENNVISATGGVTSYNDLTDKPQINNVELSGNKTLNDLGVQKKILFERPLFVAPTTNNYTVGDLFYYNQKIYKYQGTSYDSLHKFSKMTYEVVGRKIYFTTNETPPNGENFPTKYISTYRVGDIYVNQDNPPANTEGVLNGDIYICTKVLFNYISSTKTVTYSYTWKTLPLHATTLAEYGIIDAYTKSEIDAKLSALVSAVVNANGTITFTDSKGNSFTTSGESVIGPQGAPGQDYVLTAQDKDDIADIVLGELPTTEGVLYGNQSN